MSTSNLRMIPSTYQISSFIFPIQSEFPKHWDGSSPPQLPPPPPPPLEPSLIENTYSLIYSKVKKKIRNTVWNETLKRQKFKYWVSNYFHFQQIIRFNISECKPFQMAWRNIFFRLVDFFLWILHTSVQCSRVQFIFFTTTWLPPLWCQKKNIYLISSL